MSYKMLCSIYVDIYLKHFMLQFNPRCAYFSSVLWKIHSFHACNVMAYASRTTFVPNFQTYKMVFLSHQNCVSFKSSRLKSVFPVCLCLCRCRSSPVFYMWNWLALSLSRLEWGNCFCFFTGQSTIKLFWLIQVISIHIQPYDVDVSVKNLSIETESNNFKD